MNSLQSERHLLGAKPALVVALALVILGVAVAAVNFTFSQKGARAAPCSQSVACPVLLDDRFSVSNVTLPVGGKSAQVWVRDTGSLALDIREIYVYEENGSGLFVVFNNSTYTSSTTCGSRATPTYGTATWHVSAPGDAPQKISLSLPPGCNGFVGGTSYFVNVIDRYGSSFSLTVNATS